MTDTGSRDGRTRRRLIEVATRLFAERGFKHVTVRDISREARANVAAVNYHFSDKLGLYREVYEQAVRLVTQMTEEAMHAGEGLPAEARLRAYIRIHCEHTFRMGPTTRIQQLIHRELQEPTEILASLIDRVWRPRFEYLAVIVAELLGLPQDDARVVRSVVSIHIQVVMFRPTPSLERLGTSVAPAFTADAVADHITAFSLAGLGAYRKKRQKSGARLRDP